MSFSNSTYGKCILAGEHSVLRGIPAVVFPVISKQLTLKYEDGERQLEIDFAGETGASYQLLFSGVIDEALKKLELKREMLSGHCELTGNLPIGTGLGASAALCVNVSALFNHLGLVLKKDLYNFSRDLEDLFHGESSGVDIAAAVEGQGILFTKGGDWRKVTRRWSPHLYISYSGQVGVTSECVKQVKELQANDADKASLLDEHMRSAVELIVDALERNEVSGFSVLERGINKALYCFEEWKLTKGSVAGHMDDLRHAGATAVKPTGSGNGGFILSLWSEKPDTSAVSKFGLTPIFQD